MLLCAVKVISSDFERFVFGPEYWISDMTLKVRSFPGQTLLNERVRPRDFDES